MTQTLAPERTIPVDDGTQRFVRAVNAFAPAVAHHWLTAVIIALGVFVLLPFIAPALLAIGVKGPADAIYFLYGFVCHQLPQRSLFLFGHKLSYSLAELGQAYPFTDYAELRAIIGSQAMGWKMAWSDRMFALYGSAWVGSIAYELLRRRHPHISPTVWFILAAVPMGLDGLTHVVNGSLAGISGTGFRDTNAWLAALTANLLPAKFYAGDALGSFNNWARLITGSLTGLATVFLVYPLVDSAMQDVRGSMEGRRHSPYSVQVAPGTRVSADLLQRSEAGE